MGDIDLTQRTGLGYLRKYATEMNRLSIGSILGMKDHIDLDPEYQRGHVWEDGQRSAYMGALLEGRANDSSAIVLFDNFATNQKFATDQDSDTLMYEVVDGKQRLTSIYKFLANEVSARFYDGYEVYYEDLDKMNHLAVRNGITVGVGIVGHLSKKGVLELYLALNTGGTLHTSAEIDRVKALVDAA